MKTSEALSQVIRKLQLGCAADIAEGSGNSVSTVYNWRNNPVKRPHLLTFSRFLKYYGYSIEITKDLLRPSVKPPMQRDSRSFMFPLSMKHE